MNKNKADGNVLSRLTGVVIGIAITALVVLFGVGLFIASGRASDYAPVITRATQSPTATPVTADRRVTVITTTLDSDGALSVTFEAAQISGDILFAPPVLQVGPSARFASELAPSTSSGQALSLSKGQAAELTATPESLKAARLAMLAAITDGKATATLTFTDAPLDARRGTLVFNPSSQPGNIVNPRIEVAIVW